MDVFGSLRSIIKTDQVCIDNNVFRLHYKASVIFLVACSIVVTSRQYIGDPISCNQHDAVPAAVINTYCWIHATFTIPSALSKKVGVEVAHPGVDKYTSKDDRLDSPVISDGAKASKKKLLLDYIVGNLHCHNIYVGVFIFCEILNFINVVGQIYFMNMFLGGQFTSYGTDVIKFTETDQEDRVDPMIRVFPRVTKCTFHQYGPSGDVQKHDAICVLPLNIVNEKIYVFLWFWFVFMAIISGLCLVFRAIVVIFPKVRHQLLRMRSRLVQRDYVEIVVMKAQLGDWFVLDLLGKNMDGMIYRELLMDLARRFEGKEIL
ncbi:hypothetical protein CHUAL_003287 [Chamberlinius hualienensis]